MKTTTATFILSLSLFLIFSNSAQNQEIRNEQSDVVPYEEEQETQLRNTFIDYNSYIVAAEDFKFRKEFKKVKKDTLFLEYSSPDNNIIISKYDYLKLVRRVVNQSDSKTEFIIKFTEYFPDTENRFAQTLDLESFYARTRPRTFFGYFDGLPMTDNDL